MSKERADSLKETQPFYSPREVMDHFDSVAAKDARGISVRESGLKALDEGTENALVTNPTHLLAEAEAATQARVFKNRADKALMEIARTQPDNTIGLKVETPVGVDANGINIYGEVPTGQQRIYAWENGQRVAMLAPDKFAKSWVLSDPAMNEQLSAWLRWGSGSPILKATASGALAPEFAVLNPIRDAAHAYTATQLYSPLVPIGAAQMATDYAQVAAKPALREKLKEIYYKNGGGMEWLASSRTPEQALKKSIETGTVEATGKAINKINEISEIWTRLALLNRGLKNGLSEADATYEARHYMDFAEGGTVTKAADQAVPYLNAGVVGTRGLLRAARIDPAGTSLKIAQTMAFAAGITTQLVKHYRFFYDSLPDREKESKYIFPLPLSEKTDSKGNRTYKYIAIPKDQGQRAITAVAEGIAEYAETGTFPFKRVQMGLAELSPTDITPLPPTIKGIISYIANTDPYTWERAWRGREDVEPSAEFTAKTPEAFVQAGQATGTSPTRLKTATGQVIADNAYTHMLGLGVNAAMTGKLDAKERSGMLDYIIEAPVVRRLVRETRPVDIGEANRKLAAKLGVPLTYSNGEARPGRVIMQDLDIARRKRGTQAQLEKVAKEKIR